MSSPSLLSLSQLRGIQKLGELGMNQVVEIYRKSDQAKDPTDPYGDDVVVYATAPIKVMGWLVTKPTERLDLGEGQVRTISTHQVRVPVGTAVLPGDRVRVVGEEFIVTDATNEQSWPEWTIAYLRGYQNA